MSVICLAQQYLTAHASSSAWGMGYLTSPSSPFSFHLSFTKGLLHGVYSSAEYKQTIQRNEFRTGHSFSQIKIRIHLSSSTLNSGTRHPEEYVSIAMYNRNTNCS
jgi:hypothetical protein